MSVAKCLGLADGASVLLGEARGAWPRWCEADPGLAVVDDLLDMPAWTLLATGAEKNAVIGRLVSLTTSHPEAVAALAWLLVPGATALASHLRDLDADIDSLVAGQLWIEIVGAHDLQASGQIAAAILRRARREVCADLGVGDLAQRRDRAWACSTADDQIDTWLVADEPEPDAAYEAVELLRAAWRDEAIVFFDMWLLWNLAVIADQLKSPARRGRAGLTTPTVVEGVARGLQLSPRTLRRRAAMALDRVREYGVAREDPATLAEWKHQHPLVPLTAREELELALREEEWWDLVTGAEKLSPDEASARLWTGPERRHRA